jgi:hypothetical protein
VRSEEGEKVRGLEGGRENDGRWKREDGRWTREEKKLRREEVKKVRRKGGREV